METFTVADLLGCVGADLIDTAQRIEQLPPGFQAAAAGVELFTMSTASDALSVEVRRALAAVGEVIASLDQQT